LSDVAPFETAFAHSVVDAKYMKPHGETHWYQTARRAVKHPMAALTDHCGVNFDAEKEALCTLVEDRHFMPGGRYLYASGNALHQVQNCLLLSCEDSREGWADLGWKSEMALLTGAGIGVYWGHVRPNGSRVKRTGGTASGPVPKMIATNEQGRAAVQGGDRRCAIWAGLPWWHSDVFWFMRVKQWPQYLKDAKASDPSVAAPMDMTNISVCLDDEFFYHFDHSEGMRRGVCAGKFPAEEHAPDGGTWHDWAHRVYWTAIDGMTQTGEPGFSVDLGDKRDEKLRNACTEIVSADDSDICNLGGLVLSRFDDPREFEKAVRLGVLYLTAGSVYSDVPYPQVAEVREKNRRLGLDVMGVHEFLLMRGLRYGSDDAFEALEPFMFAYERALEFAHDWQDMAGLSHTIAATSGAPTGTRAIGAETTTGWQTVTSTAYKRSVITSKAHESDARTEHYVVDPTVARLLRQGYISADDTVEDSYALANDYERVFRMQQYAQSHTDQAISMTVNLPHVMTSATERRHFGETLYKYLPDLRGITVYPNGAIAGQPITPCPLAEAVAANNMVIEEDEEKCASGVCGL
jgi:ribonucleoside-diphosphate reductase alpha chain